MRDRNVTAMQLAYDSKVSLGTIYRARRGERLFADTAGALARVLDVSIEELIGHGDGRTRTEAEIPE
jgi:transcriptional regulator with XRE-family HTH domain